MRLRHLAPSGAPIRTRDLVSWTARVLSPADPSRALRAALGERVGARQFHPVSTGRAALTLILQAMRDIRPAQRDEVIIPAYTCFSVPASVLKAGLTPRLVDMAPDTLDYDFQRLLRADLDRVLAIVATNLYGFPNDMPRLSGLARDNGIFLVDDAAQALGASVGGHASGTWGDAGLYSFDKGKNISAIDGGVVVTEPGELGHVIAGRIDHLPHTPARRVAAKIGTLAAYSVLLHPRLYWLPNSIPQLGLGKTPFDTSFPLEALSRPMAALALTMLHRLETYTRQRRSNACAIASRVEPISGVDVVRPIPSAAPAYLRLPLLASDQDHRRRLLEALNAAGIGATGSYPSSIADIPELAGMLVGDVDPPGARFVADRIVTLPTHPYVSPDDVERMTVTIARVSTGRARPARRPEAAVPVEAR
jgi:perosamine synthetase